MAKPPREPDQRNSPSPSSSPSPAPATVEIETGKGKTNALVLGSLAFDYIMDSPENYYEALSIDHDTRVVQGTFLSVKKVMHFGGTAGNISYNMAKLGGTPILVAAVGEDYSSQKYDKHLEAHGILARVHVVPCDSTASCYIFNDAARNQLTIFHGGALNHGHEIDLRKQLSPSDKIGIAINAPNGIDAMVSFSRQLKEMGIFSIFDPGQVLNALSAGQFEEILQNSQAFISNDHEFSGVKKRFGINLEDMLGDLDWIITTRGGDGADILDGNGTTRVHAAMATKVVDPTGAGDAFRGGLLRGLTMGLELVDAARVGAIMGSINVENQGGQGYPVDLELFRKRYRESYDSESPI